ncbi:hypothetical protein, partial [Staphylococcus aureus]|uniref:hypothetical protein n=1 Tax=Staphylococcus aureus TaxID=1280 RepID=UPI0034DD880D|nr:hypothetical protein [Staphylococcus aureus]
PQQMQTSGATSATPAQIAALPEPIHGAVISGFAEAMQVVFLAAAPLMVAGFFGILFLREIPLRQHSSVEVFEGVVDPDLPE